MSGIVFDGMSGVKKLANFHDVINCPTSANEALISTRSVSRIFWLILSEITEIAYD